MRNKVRMCALTCPFQYDTRGRSQRNETRKQNKRQTDGKILNKIVFIGKQDCLCTKSK